VYVCDAIENEPKYLCIDSKDFRFLGFLLIRSIYKTQTKTANNNNRIKLALGPQFKVAHPPKKTRSKGRGRSSKVFGSKAAEPSTKEIWRSRLEESLKVNQKKASVEKISDNGRQGG